METKTPQKEDWLNSPFDSPEKIQISLVQVRILGMPVSFGHQKFKLLLANAENDKVQRIWMKIESNLFSKPQVVFSKE